MVAKLVRLFVLIILPYTIVTIISRNSTPNEIPSGIRQSWCDHQVVYVDRVIDGDTFVIDDENGTRVRLIGIDTKELTSENPTDKKHAQLAKRATKYIIEQSDNEVCIESFAIDKYKRTLAWVTLKDGESLQEQLIDRGLAEPMIIQPFKYDYVIENR